MSKEKVDPNGLAPDSSPSGESSDAEVRETSEKELKKLKDALISYGFAGQSVEDLLENRMRMKGFSHIERVEIMSDRSFTGEREPEFFATISFWTRNVGEPISCLISTRRGVLDVGAAEQDGKTTHSIGRFEHLFKRGPSGELISPGDIVVENNIVQNYSEAKVFDVAGNLVRDIPEMEHGHLASLHGTTYFVGILEGDWQSGVKDALGIIDVYTGERQVVELPFDSETAEGRSQRLDFDKDYENWLRWAYEHGAKIES